MELDCYHRRILNQKNKKILPLTQLNGKCDIPIRT